MAFFVVVVVFFCLLAYSASVICVAAVCSHIERLWGVLGRVVQTASDARYVTFWVVGCKQQVTHVTSHSASWGANNK